MPILNDQLCVSMHTASICGVITPSDHTVADVTRVKRKHTTNRLESQSDLDKET